MLVMKCLKMKPRVVLYGAFVQQVLAAGAIVRDHDQGLLESLMTGIVQVLQASQVLQAIAPQVSAQVQVGVALGKGECIAFQGMLGNVSPQVYSHSCTSRWLL